MGKMKIAVIGGGPGGYVAAIRAAQLGGQVIVIDEDQIGGTCLNRGCIPTKSLLQDAKMLGAIKHSNVFNQLIIESFNPFNAIMRRKETVVQNMVGGVEMLLKSNQVVTIRGKAELISPKQLLVNQIDGSRKMIEVDRIILAMGSKVSTPNNLKPDGNTIITSNEALQLNSLPKQIVIIGGGYIGVEFATFFNALGTEVTIIEIQERILSGFDDELSRNIHRILVNDGIKIHTTTAIASIEKIGHNLRIQLSSQNTEFDVLTEKMMLATGRVPNLNIDFAKAGIAFSTEGVKVDRHMETTAAGVYAIGDVIGGIQLAHVAMKEGEIAAENAMGILREIKDYPVPFCIFTNPEIAAIGMTEREAREKGPVAIGRFPFRSNPTAIIHDQMTGFIKVVVDKQSDLILGIHILGHEASALISVASSLIYQDVKGKVFAEFMQAHPTTSEALKEAFLNIYGKAIHAPKTMIPKVRA